MQLQNFECQIAKAQIGRFLAGDLLGDETLQQLEAHIAKCPDCKQNLAERKAVLQAMLNPAEPTTSTQHEPATKAKFDLAEFVKSKIHSKQPVQAAVQVSTAKSSTLTKPALYSVALGIVLIGMSYMSKNVGSILGPTAAIPAAAAPPAQAAPKVTPGPATVNPLVKPQPTASTAPTTKPVAPPATTAKPKTLPTPPKEALKTEHPRHHKTPHHDSNTVRAYEPEN